MSVDGLFCQLFMSFVPFMCHPVIVLLEIPGFGFDTQVFLCITCFILHSMAFLIDWICIVHINGKLRIS